MGKKHFIGTAAAGLAALLLSVAGACTDEGEERLSPGERIGFAVDLWQEGQRAQAALTKGADVAAGGTSADTLPAVRVIALKGEGSEDGEPLYLHAVTTDGIGDAATAQDGGARTKAAPVDNATMYDEMAVTAFVYPAAQSWPAAYTGSAPGAELYMRTVRVKKSESWNTAYYWPGAARKISFFASAPYGLPGLTAFNDGSSGTPPYLSYAVPANVADQKDLLVAASTDRPGNTNTAEALTMRHALTGVRFVTGDDMLAGTVSRITLKNVYGTGRLPLTASPVWYGLGGKTTFVQPLAVTTPDPNVPGTEITPAAATFMMLPQTLPAGAQIEVKYTDKLTNTQRTLTADIAGSVWPMGKTVTYRISTGSIVITPTLTVTGPEDFEHTGGNKNYTVRSYVQVTRPGDPTMTNPAPWTAEFSEDDGGSWSATPPVWLTAFTGSGEGSISATAYQATVNAQTHVFNHPQNAVLKAATPVNDGTNANIYDLSTKGGTAVMRTANCYIVNAAGRYRLPLVYGNAVDYAKVPGGPNPGRNTSAYSSTESGPNVLKPFINHRGVGITDPYIYNNENCTPSSCTLVWQDEPNLVTNVALSSDGHFLEFTVNQATIRQGNAVVAVRDASNTVLWSWHIWVTDYVPGTGDKAITNFQGDHYTLMPVHLGWCDGWKRIYAERTVKVRFKQTGTDATQTITVKQKAHTTTDPGNNTYYQWGRKDPIVGISSYSDVAKTWYNESGEVQTNQSPLRISFEFENACITSGITQPNVFCSNTKMDNKYANLWSANNTLYTMNANPVVKTIYDPSPVGYKLPSSNAFTGFTTTGENAHYLELLNVQEPYNNGWNFYCDPSKTTTIFFPTSGIWSYYTNKTNGRGTIGGSWSAGPGDSSTGRLMSFYRHGLVFLSNKGERASGFPVRPCQE